MEENLKWLWYAFSAAWVLHILYLVSLAQRGELVSYEVVDESGPPHDRTFRISAVVSGIEVGLGEGRSKKDAEQEAARVALEALGG